MRVRPAVLAAVLGMISMTRSWAAEVQSIYSLSMLGGQYFFNGQKGTLSGDVTGLVAPVFTFNDRCSLLPSLYGTYQGTKQVVDLVGAGTLFQEELAFRGGAKAVYRPEGSDWRIKPSFGYKADFLKETKDESFGSDLFDYRTLSTGLEGEYVYKDPFSVRLAYDFFYTSYPNYTSLESQSQLDLNGQPLARELVGDYVLDNYDNMLTVAVTAPLGRGLFLDSRLLFQYQNFPNQGVVNASGLLQPNKREDLVTSFDATLRAPAELTPDVKLLSGVTIGAATAVSNQNSFDATRTQYLPKFYNYNQLSLGPEFKFVLGDEREPIVCTLSGSWTYRRYPYRLVQGSDGAYQSQGLYQNTYTVAAGAAYPMAPHFKLVFNFQYGRAVSNEAFQQFYVYNYNATTYMFGFTWGY